MLRPLNNKNPAQRTQMKHSENIRTIDDRPVIAGTLYEKVTKRNTHITATMVTDQKLNWALESIDLSTLVEDFSKEPVPSMLNNCSTQRTLSTVGSSLAESWGCDSDSDSVAEYELFQRSILAQEAAIPEEDVDDESSIDLEGGTGESSEYSHLSLLAKGGRIPEEDDEGSIDLEGSESSLDLLDLKTFAQEDEVGIYNPERRDELPPPKPRTDFKGDSQNSFTLEDLEQIPKGNISQAISIDSNDESLSLLNEDKRSKKPSLKGILKNGYNTKEKRSSVAMQQMERSSMLNLSLDGSIHFEDIDEDEESYSPSSNKHTAWSMMQQSFAMEDIGGLDLQAFEEKSVSFGKVCVHEHPVTAGDNPSVSEGVPISLAWQAQSSRTFSSFEDFEMSCKRRPARKIEAEERMWMLMNAGVSLKEIQHAELMANASREEREATKQQHLLLLTEHASFIRAIRAEEEEDGQWKDPHRRGRTLSRQSQQAQDQPRRILVVSPERDTPTMSALSA